MLAALKSKFVVNVYGPLTGLLLLFAMMTAPCLKADQPNTDYDCTPKTYSTSATFYDNSTLGLAACHYADPTLPGGTTEATQFYAAAATEIYNDDICGACIQITDTGNSKKVTVMVTDECPAASNAQWCDQTSGMGDGVNNGFHLDLSQNAFNQLEASAVGHMPITWNVVPCPLSYLNVIGQNGTSLSYSWKDGANSGFASIIIRDYIMPIASVNFGASSTGPWTATTWQRSYNGWLANSGTWSTVYAQITDKSGNTSVFGPISCCGTQLSPDTGGSGSAAKHDTGAKYAALGTGQMPGCGAPTATFTSTRTPTVCVCTPTDTPTPSITPVPPADCPDVLNPAETLTDNGTWSGTGATRSIGTFPGMTGSGALKVAVTTPSGFNDQMADLSAFTPTNWTKYDRLTVDVYVDPAALPWSGTSTYHQLSLRGTSVSNSEYEVSMGATAAQSDLPIVAGINHLSFGLSYPGTSLFMNAAGAAAISEVFFILNQDGQQAGNIYLDNIVLHTDAICPPSSPTDTPTRTPTATPTRTATPSMTSTRTDSPTFTVTPTSSASPSYTSTGTVSATRTVTGTPTSTDTPVPATATFTTTPTGSATDSRTASPSSTGSATPTDSRTVSPSSTSSASPTDSRTATASPTQTVVLPTSTSTNTPLPGSTFTDTGTASPSVTATPSASGTATRTSTSTVTVIVPTSTSTGTPLPGSTFTDTGTATPSVTVLIPSATSTSTATPTDSRTATASSTQTVVLPSFTSTDTPLPGSTSTDTPTQTPLPTFTQTSTVTPSSSVTLPPSATLTFSASPSFTDTRTPIPAGAPGEGSMTVSPASVTEGDTGLTFMFTYTAVSAWANGTLTLDLPAGWPAPSATGSNAAFTTFSSNGTGAVLTLGASSLSISLASLPAGGSITISYGAKSSGGSGLTVPNAPGFDTFTVLTDPSGSAVADIATEPAVDVKVPTATLTATKTLTPTSTLVAVAATSTPTAGPEGPNDITKHSAYPNPWSGQGPAMVAAQLAGRCDSLTLKVYTNAMVCVGSRELGPQNAGWVQIPMPTELVSGAGNGTYYYIITAQRGSTTNLTRAVGKFLVLR